MLTDNNKSADICQYIVHL